MKVFSFLLSFFLTASLFAQNSPLLRFDLITGEKTVIPVADADPNMTAAKTEHFIGTANSDINDLPTVAPTENIYPDTEFTLRQKTTELFDLDASPLRTHVRVLHEDADTTRAVFTGTMVSRKHVLMGAYTLTAP